MATVEEIFKYQVEERLKRIAELDSKEWEEIRKLPESRIFADFERRWRDIEAIGIVIKTAYQNGYEVIFKEKLDDNGA